MPILMLKETARNGKANKIRDSKKTDQKIKVNPVVDMKDRQ